MSERNRRGHGECSENQDENAGPAHWPGRLPGDGMTRGRRPRERLGEAPGAPYLTIRA
jgi:hypothetical protein